MSTLTATPTDTSDVAMEDPEHPPVPGAVWVREHMSAGYLVRAHWRRPVETGNVQHAGNDAREYDPAMDDDDTTPVTHKLNKKDERNIDDKSFHTMDFGDAAEIVADLDILLGRARFSKTMPYDENEVAFIEIKGFDSNKIPWKIRVHPDGKITGPHEGEEKVLSGSDLANLSEYAETMKGYLNARARAKSNKEKAGNDKRWAESANISEDARALKLAEAANTNNLANEAINTAKENLGAMSLRVSRLLNVPEDKMMKSMGEKADVRIGIAGINNPDDVDLVSTKSFLKKSNPTLFSDRDAPNSTMIASAKIPECYAGRPEVLARELKQLGGDSKRISYLKNIGADFHVDEDAVRAQNKLYMDSIDAIGKEMGLGDNASSMFISAVGERVNNSDPNPNNLSDESRRALMAVCILRGSTDYNPSDKSAYDKNTNDRIDTYADVVQGLNKERAITTQTIVSRRSREKQMEWLLEHGSFTLATSHTPKNAGTADTRMYGITIRDGKIFYPVSVGFSLKRNVSTIASEFS